MICIDANLVVRIIRGSDIDPVRQLWQSWADQRRTLVAPSLLRYEVTNAFRRLALGGTMTHEEARLSVQAAIQLPVRLHDEADLHLSALDFSQRFKLPAAYDAHYLALAERLGVEFYTGDRRLWNSVRQQVPWVQFVGIDSENATVSTPR